MICNNVAIPCSHARIGNTLNLKLFGCGHLLKPPLRFPLVMAKLILWEWLRRSQEISGSSRTFEKVSWIPQGPRVPRRSQEVSGGPRRSQGSQQVPGGPRRSPASHLGTRHWSGPVVPVSSRNRRSQARSWPLPSKLPLGLAGLWRQPLGRAGPREPSMGLAWFWRQPFGCSDLRRLPPGLADQPVST